MRTTELKSSVAEPRTADRTYCTSPVPCVRMNGTPTIQSESGFAPRRSLAGSTEDACASVTP
jgi:hypothetical protein